MNAWKFHLIICTFLSLGLSSFSYGDDETPPWEEAETEKAAAIVDNSFPELNYENMNIQAANPNEVELKPTSNTATKIAISYYGKQKEKERKEQTSETYPIDESQLISGSAPLYQ